MVIHILQNLLIGVVLTVTYSWMEDLTFDKFDKS